MTSKEAIKRLRQETAPVTYMADFDKEECLKVIEKDLEVLEIIKKGFSKNFLAERLKDAYLRDDLNDEDYDKIKEWLENENVN